MKQENVNHPAHYNQHPAGIECIDIIRHYTCDIANALKYLMRAGKKSEMGMDDAEKEIEDLKKALWYIEDYCKHINKRAIYTVAKAAKEAKAKGITDRQVCEAQIEIVSGYSIVQIMIGYDLHVAYAMRQLLQIGIISGEGRIFMPRQWRSMLNTATEAIQERILDIEMQLTNGERQKTVDVLHGKAVEGEHYATPGGKRETEPDKYDPLNIIIIQGTAYCLSDEVRKKENGALYGPCDNCALSEYCVSNDGTESLKNLCRLHYATDQQYYREVGTAEYAPSFGTIEVVDVHKEHELELKRLEEELNKEG